MEKWRDREEAYAITKDMLQASPL